MEKVFLSPSFNNRLGDEATFQGRLQQAEVCCEQARLAGRQRRFRAACGLFATAAALYQRALTQDGVSPTFLPASLQVRLNEIEREIALCSEQMRAPVSASNSLNAAQATISPRPANRWHS